MTIWDPDTCYCRVEYDDSFNIIKWHNRCKLHRSAAYSDLHTHNRTNNPTDALKVLALESAR